MRVGKADDFMSAADVVFWRIRLTSRNKKA